ncbi:DUF2639 domain-containing protein [Anaerobacillus sp. MEB173]
MSHVGSKGWYVAKLKDLGIRKHKGYYIERFKTFELANLYAEKINKK